MNQRRLLRAATARHGHGAAVPRRGLPAGRIPGHGLRWRRQQRRLDRRQATVTTTTRNDVGGTAAPPRPTCGSSTSPSAKAPPRASATGLRDADWNVTETGNLTPARESPPPRCTSASTEGEQRSRRRGRQAARGAGRATNSRNRRATTGRDRAGDRLGSGPWSSRPPRCSCPAALFVARSRATRSAPTSRSPHSPAPPRRSGPVRVADPSAPGRSRDGTRQVTWREARVERGLESPAGRHHRSPAATIEFREMFRHRHGADHRAGTAHARLPRPARPPRSASAKRTRWRPPAVRRRLPLRRRHFQGPAHRPPDQRRPRLAAGPRGRHRDAGHHHRRVHRRAICSTATRRRSSSTRRPTTSPTSRPSSTSRSTARRPDSDAGFR